MKCFILNNRVISLLFVIAMLISCLGGAFIYAGEETDLEVVDDEQIRTILDEGYNQELVYELFGVWSRKTGYPDSYTADISKCIAELSVPTTFSDDIVSNDFNLEEYFYSNKEDLKPTIYIPIYASVQNENRVVGHAVIRYNIEEKKYVTRTSFLNIEGSNFLSGEYRHFCEEIDIMRQNGIIPENEKVLLIRYPSAFNDYTEKIGVYSINGKVNVIDFYNSAGADAPKSVFEFENYLELRKEYEKKVYKGNPASNPTEWAFGGAGNRTEIEKLSEAPIKNFLTASLVSIGAILLITSVVVIVLRIRKKS